MAPGKNSVSLAEKKARILKFFQEEHTVYNMKELEKLIPKRCGISSMIVKELVQNMIDEDGLISVEKCGNINVYWSFQNQIQNKLNEEGSKLEREIMQLNEEIQKIKSLYQNEVDLGGRTESIRGKPKWKRSTQLDLLKELTKKRQELNRTYDEIVKNSWNETRVEREKEDLVKSLHEADIIAENIETIVGHISSKYSININDIHKELELPVEFEEFHEMRRNLIT